MASYYDNHPSSMDMFPSIVIGPNKSIVPKGSFAEAQAQYLDPDPDAVARLGDALLKANMGVVAHYYMDVELQGVLTAVQRLGPEFQNRIGIADSLKMGDMAVAMCESSSPSSSNTNTNSNSNTNSTNHQTTPPVQAVACLGVDFMSESVAAILHRNHYSHIPVYRATSAAIGCSLAESAERDSYRAWLEHERNQEQALHVVYINTSLESKAVSTSIVPTITCTSSNVVQTMLQASAQIGPDLKILFGPDTYMGENLKALFGTILSGSSKDNNANDAINTTATTTTTTGWTDERIQQELHPAHNRQTLQQLCSNLHIYPMGNCIVHHMFGSSVVSMVQDHYSDCFVTAHLEVPGEMFSIAMEKSISDQGVVGSTSDILRFIARHATQAATTGTTTTSMKRLRFILGTEAGMVTSIVQSVQDILEQTKSQHVEVEIIFPVASQAVMGVPAGEDPHGLAIVPGVSGGEGCSTAGGCATCPFMKMNDLDALLNILDMVESSSLGNNNIEMKLKAHLPPDRLRGKRINGVPAMDLGVESIMYMRDFMANKELPKELIDKIRAGAQRP